jgi:hypothetical protein
MTTKTVFRKEGSSESWLEKVRRADRSVQYFWLYTLSGVTMAAVITLWSGYMSFEMPSVEPVNKKIVLSQKTAPVAMQKDELSFDAGLALLARAFGLGVSKSMAYVKDVIKNDLLGAAATIVTKPRSPTDFMLEDLPKLPVQSLPID